MSRATGPSSASPAGVTASLVDERGSFERVSSTRREWVFATAWAQAIGLSAGAVVLGIAAWQFTPGVVALSCFDACVRPTVWSYVVFGVAWACVAAVSILALASIGARRERASRVDWLVVAAPMAVAAMTVHFVGLLP